MKDINIKNASVVPVAMYSVVAATIPLLAHTPLTEAVKLTVFPSLFLSPAVGLLAVLRFAKGDRSRSILFSAALGTIGTVCWVFILSRKLNQ